MFQFKGQTFALPELTKLEQFAWDNSDRAPGVLAQELNRPERDINAAYSRALSKMRDRGILLAEGIEIAK